LFVHAYTTGLQHEAMFEEKQRRGNGDEVSSKIFTQDDKGQQQTNVVCEESMDEAMSFVEEKAQSL
jgi:hypothetical protein